MKKQMLLLIGIFIFSFIKSQNTEYISIGKDQYGNSLFYKIDKTLNNEFYFGVKDGTRTRTTCFTDMHD